jgi:hypothetical protein
MVATTSDRPSNGQLERILYETANWTVNGFQGLIFCEVASLRLALDRASELSSRGKRVVALVRKRPTKTVVFSAQFRTLEDHFSEPLVSPISVVAMKA